MTRGDSSRHVLICCVSLCAVWGLVACDHEEIRAYHVPKDPPVSVASIAPENGGGPAIPPMDWVVPQQWRRLPGDRPMRVATFEATSPSGRVEIAVSVFPDRAGGLLPNVNRWRAQIGLEPIGEDALTDHLVAFTNEHVQGFLLDISGPPGGQGDPAPQRIVGAVVHAGGGMTWFVKAMGDPSELDGHKESIFDFARSFRSPGSGHDHAVHGRQDTVTPGDSRLGASWQIPDHWQPDPDRSAIVMAAFDVNHPRGSARITVTALSGDGGGALANINRWRGQLGLSPVTDLEDQPVTTLPVQGGIEATIVDLRAPGDGPHGDRRFLVAVLPRGDDTWFIKLIGPATVVDHERQAFERLVISAASPETIP